jgi:hypothetical protein
VYPYLNTRDSHLNNPHNAEIPRKKFDFFLFPFEIDALFYILSVNDDADEADEALGILTLMKSTTSPVPSALTPRTTKQSLTASWTGRSRRCA